MRKFIIFSGMLLGFTFNNSSFAQTVYEKPKLVVGIVVDQMRADYISRYYERFSENGFKRLISEGFQFRNAHYNYKGTSTGPGHTSIYTGTTPSRHGIISNSWFDKKTEKKINCVEDLDVQPVGGSKKKGLVSSKNIEVTTVTDELRLWSNHKSKVISVSFKDRGAALPAGHNPTGAYWYDRVSGDFVSSSYFVDKLPKWVRKFNKRKLAYKYSKLKWNTLEDTKSYKESIEDNNPYEKIKWGKKNPTFPYNLDNDRNPIDRFTGTPFANQMLTDIAISAIEGENLGQNTFPDFLAISYSSTDIAGHAMAPRAVEIQDMYMRLDLELARLMETLETKVGKGNYTLFLTADHGAVDNPQYLEDHKYPNKRVDNSQSEEIIKAIENKYGVGNWVQSISVFEIYLNRKLIAEKKLDLIEFQNFVAQLVKKSPFVSEVFTAYELEKRAITDPFVKLLQNSYHTKRSGDILVMTRSGYLPGHDGDKGTSHGTGFTYDTNIPVLFYGKNIPHGNTVRKVAITDIAPTISMLLNISLPSGATGVPLMELFNK